MINKTIRIDGIKLSYRSSNKKNLKMRALNLFVVLLCLVSCNDDTKIDENIVEVYKNSGFEFVGRIVNDSFAINNDYKFNTLQINYDSDICKVLHSNLNSNVSIASLSKKNKLIYWNEINCTMPVVPRNPYDMRYLSGLEISNNMAMGRLSTVTYPPKYTAIKVFSDANYIQTSYLTYFPNFISENDIALSYYANVKKIIVTTLNAGNYKQYEIPHNSVGTKNVYNFVREKGKNDHVLIFGINVPDSMQYLLLSRFDINNQSTLIPLDSIQMGKYCTYCQPIKLENVESKGDNWFIFEAKKDYKKENIIVKIGNEKLNIYNESVDCSGIEYDEYGQIALFDNKVYAIQQTNNIRNLQFFDNGRWNNVPNPIFNNLEIPTDLQVQFIKSTPKGLVVTYSGEITTNPSKKEGIIDVVLIPR